MKLKFKYKKDEFEAAVPSASHELFTLQGEEYTFTGVEGMVHESEVTTLRKSLSDEKIYVKGIKAKYAPYEALGPFAEVQAKLDKIPELEVLAAGSKSPEDLQKLVDAKANNIVVQIQRKLDEANTKVTGLETEVTGYKTKERSSTILTDLDAACVKFKVQDKHRADVKMYASLFDLVEGKVVTKDGVGVVPGLTAETWMGQMLPERPGWVAASQGSGAGGSGGGSAPASGDNPFVPGKENYTKMSAMIDTDPNGARQAIKAAGRQPSEFNL